MSNPICHGVKWECLLDLLSSLRWYHWVWAIIVLGALVLSSWAGGRKVLKKVGDFNARLILTLVYLIVLLPFGFMVRLFADPLRIKRPPTQWLDHTDEAHDLRWAKRQ